MSAFIRASLTALLIVLAAFPSVESANGEKTAIAVAAGYEYTCALLQDGASTCWGDPANGAALENLTVGTTFVQIAVFKDAKSTDKSLTCYRNAGGYVDCNGEFVAGSFFSYTGGDAVDVDVGDWYDSWNPLPAVCVTTSTGDVNCFLDWGNGEGYSWKLAYATPVDAVAVDMVISNGYVCVAESYVWSYRIACTLLWDGSTVTSNYLSGTPKKLAGDCLLYLPTGAVDLGLYRYACGSVSSSKVDVATDVLDAHASYWQNCYLQAEGNVYCQDGYEWTLRYTNPAAQSIAVGYDHFCLVLADGAVDCEMLRYDEYEHEGSADYEPVL